MASAPRSCWTPTSGRPTWTRRSAGSRLWPRAIPWPSATRTSQAQIVVLSRETCAASTSMPATCTSGRSLRERPCSRASPGRRPARMGDLVEAEGIVRAGLAATGHPTNEASIRLLRGGAGGTSGRDRRGARTPGPRPGDQAPPRGGPDCEAGAPMAEMLLAEDDPAGAFELVERVLPFNTIDPRVLDELVVFGARAAADLVQQASDDRDQAAVRRHRDALTRLMKARAALPGIIFQPSCADDTVQAARAALFAAEHGRADGCEDQVRLWRDAVAACATAGLGWEQQLGVVASCRCARRVGCLRHRGGRATAWRPPVRRPAGRRPAGGSRRGTRRRARASH